MSKGSKRILVIAIILVFHIMILYQNCGQNPLPQSSAIKSYNQQSFSFKPKGVPTIKVVHEDVTHDIPVYDIKIPDETSNLSNNNGNSNANNANSARNDFILFFHFAHPKKANLVSSMMEPAPTDKSEEVEEPKTRSTEVKSEPHTPVAYDKERHERDGDRADPYALEPAKFDQQKVQEDAEKLKAILHHTTLDMVEKGRRREGNGALKGLANNVIGAWNPSADYLRCGPQAEVVWGVIDKVMADPELRSQFNYEWRATMTAEPGHAWATATPYSNDHWKEKKRGYSVTLDPQQGGFGTSPDTLKTLPDGVSKESLNQSVGFKIPALSKTEMGKINGEDGSGFFQSIYENFIK